MPNTEKEQINFTLTEEQKQRWEEHIDDSPEHKSMSQFIRFCVERRIADGGQSPTTGPDNGEMSEIADRTRKIESNINQLQGPTSTNSKNNWIL